MLTIAILLTVTCFYWLWLKIAELRAEIKAFKNEIEAVTKAKIETLEVKFDMQDLSIKTLAKSIDELHWSERNGQ